MTDPLVWYIAGPLFGLLVVAMYAARAAGGKLNALWVMAGIGGGVWVRDHLERRATPADLGEAPPSLALPGG
jgi:hypothetical protein